MPEQRLSIEWREGEQVTAALNPASGGIQSGLVLAHGAGGNMETAFLAGFAENLAGHGFPVLRFNFSYSEKRRRVPDQAPVLEACYRQVARRAAEIFPAGVFLGGKSMGGRIASQIVAPEGDRASRDLAALKGLVFLGYPLHPPGRPEKLRDQHLYNVRIPMLFIEGTRDAFADRQLLQNVLDRLGKTARVHWIEGADHSFKVSKRKPAEVNQEILEVVADFMKTAT